MNWLRDAVPAPKLLVLPPAAVDLGEADAAIELWEHYSRKRLDDTQRLTVQVMMALDASGRWAASTTGREMARQNGKGDEFEVVELWGLVQRAEAILHTVHDAVLLATQTQQRMLGVLEGHADLRRKILRVWRGTGQQMIEMRNGGIIWYRTRTGGGGRGVDDIDRLVVDEAQHANEEQMAAVTPTLFANSNAQLNAAGTAGLDGMSRWWWSVRKRALSVDPGAFGYVGHTAEVVELDDNGKVVQHPVDPSDRRVWPGCNPAVAAGRGGGMAFLEEQFRRLGPGRFAEEHLCVWAPPPPEDDEARWLLWTEPSWQATAVSGGDGWLDGPVTLSIEWPRSRAHAWICASGATIDGRHGIMVAADAPGTGWVLDQMVEMLADEDRPIARVVVDYGSPAKSIVEPAAALGITVEVIETKQYLAATGLVFDGVLNQRIVHPADDQDALTEAVSKAQWRSYGDDRLIDRRTDVDTSPITGCVSAFAGHLMAVEEAEAFAGVVWA